MADKDGKHTIILDCRKGKKSAYKQLYKHYYVASIAIRYASSHEEAEEIINDAFLKVFEKITKWYDPEYPFKPWLRILTIRTAIDYLRKHRLSQMMLDIPHTESSVNEDVFDRISANEILALVQELSPAYRAVFNLYAVEGFKHFEIAGLLGISEGTSKSNLHKARVWLQRKIKEQYSKSEMKEYGG